MPETGEITAQLEERSAGRGVAVLRASGAFGEVSALARRLLEHPGLALVVGVGWEARPEAEERLLAAMEAFPLAAFAFGGAEGSGEPSGPSTAAMRVDAEALVALPREIGAVAIRCSEAVRLGWPDFGPPDFVLDGAATWALAAALAVRGGKGLYVPGARPRRLDVGAASIDRLRPEGLAWLASCALGWAPLGRPTAALSERLWRRWTGDMAVAGFDGLTPPGAGGR